MNVLNGLLIFHSEVDGSNLLPSSFVVGWYVILQGHKMWEKFKIRMKRESVKSELYGSTQYRHEMSAPVPENKSRRLCWIQRNTSRP